MGETCQLAILSDIHYAGPAERARGEKSETRGIPNPLLRWGVHFYRHFVWLREPLQKGYLLERFLESVPAVDYVIANGDYTCDSQYLGLSDPAACQSAQECLGRLRQRYGERLRLNYGDHELGKVSLFGGYGGMRLASWRCSRQELGLEPFWQLALGNYVLVGIVSSLVALPIFEPDTLPEERTEWERLRAEHLGQIRETFGALRPEQRVILFCHDPTALPFLGQEPAVAAKLPQLEQTIIGHLHSNLILWKSRVLAGMPRITFLGHTARRLSGALRQARQWGPFKVRLCPSLAGTELLKDGGYLTAELDLAAKVPVRFQLHRLPR